jgi:2-polyprenyl-6-methoxyphenol hydroxylase-like FAD-dependent oxidoreductase
VCAGSQAIAVVGGGTAGAASALFLARAGHRVTLFERVPDPSAVGAGILLQPTGMLVLNRLGLLDEVASHCAPIEKLYGTKGISAKESMVLDVHYRHYAPNSFGLGLHRGVLFSALWHALAGAGVDVRSGVDVHDIAQTADQAQLYGTGAELGSYDCVIIADGSRSKLRGKLAIPVSVKPYPWGALWAMLPDDGTTPKTLRQWFCNAHQMLGLMPTGFGWQQKQAPLLSFFWSLHQNDLAPWRDGGLDQWKKTVLALAPISSVLDHIKDPAQLTFASYADIAMPFWHDRRVVCIGDCAHATSPQLGQGANLALVDAMTLAQCIAEQGDIPSSLAAYSKQRKAHLRYYQNASRLLTPLFQSHSRVGSGLRDLFLGAICRAPYTRRQMSLTLSGTKAGWIHGSLPVDNDEIFGGHK